MYLFFCFFSSQAVENLKHFTEILSAPVLRETRLLSFTHLQKLSNHSLNVANPCPVMDSDSKRKHDCLEDMLTDIISL